MGMFGLAVLGNLDSTLVVTTNPARTSGNGTSSSPPPAHVARLALPTAKSDYPVQLGHDSHHGYPYANHVQDILGAPARFNFLLALQGWLQTMKVLLKLPNKARQNIPLNQDVSTHVCGYACFCFKIPGYELVLF